MRSTILLLPLLFTGLTATDAALAQSFAIKAGAILYQPHSKTDGVRGIGIPPGADIDVGSATTVMLIGEVQFTPNTSVELVLGVPPRVKAKGTGTVAFLGDDVLSAKNVAPTLLFNYTFGEPGQKLRPYIGAGVNYTRFTGIRSRLAPQVSMTDSVGPVVQAGLSLQLAPNWGLFTSVARLEVKTEVVAVASSVLRTTVDFRPVTYSLGTWYRF